MLITIDDVQKYYDKTIKSKDIDTINMLIDGVSDFAKTYCNRSWTAQSGDVEYFDGGGNTFFPANAPISAISEITIDGSIITTGYHNYGSYIKLEFIVPRGFKNVKITYTSGATLPSDVRLALVRWVVEILKSKPHGGKNVTRISMGSTSVDFTSADGMPEFVKNVLDAHRFTNI